MSFFQGWLWWNSASVSWRCIILSNIVYWILSLIGLLADHLAETNQSPLLRKCKTQPKEYLSWKDKKDLTLLTSFNMLFIGIYICCPLHEWVWNQVHGGSQHRLNESDDWIWQKELLITIPISFLIVDFGFYFSHYLLHYLPFLYKNIHKIHHRFKAPTTMACVYSHPLEFIIGNLLPVSLGPILTNAHPYTTYVWWMMCMGGTCFGHCGYTILGHKDPHDDHHIYNNIYYGGICVSDWLLGTTIKTVS